MFCLTCDACSLIYYRKFVCSKRKTCQNNSIRSSRGVLSCLTIELLPKFFSTKMLDSQGMSIHLLTDATVNKWQLNKTDFLYWHLSNFNDYVVPSLPRYALPIPVTNYMGNLWGNFWTEIQTVDLVLAIL